MHLYVPKLDMPFNRAASSWYCTTNAAPFFISFMRLIRSDVPFFPLLLSRLSRRSRSDSGAPGRVVQLVRRVAGVRLGATTTSRGLASRPAVQSRRGRRGGVDEGAGADTRTGGSRSRHDGSSTHGKKTTGKNTQYLIN